MKKNILKLTLLAVSFCYCASLTAQNKHEFSIIGGGGLSSLQYTPSVGEQKTGIGGLLGVGYQFFLSPNWSIGTSAEFAFYNSTFKLPALNTRYMVTDIENNNFEFRNIITNYEEKQNITLLQIPLMLHFQSGDKYKFYIAAGGKIGINLSGNYSSKSASIENTGYYAHENCEYTTQEFMGFGTFANTKAKGTVDVKTAFFASAEVGMKWKLNEKLSLYTGAYLDYGLNNINNAKSEHAQPLQFVEYNTTNPRDFAVNSIVKSQYTQNGTTKPFISKISPIAAGVKVRFCVWKK
jgi:hypothetical protein